MSRFRTIFPDGKPLIAMAHVPALPGTPLYDADAGLPGAIAAVRRDVDVLLERGVRRGALLQRERPALPASGRP